MNVFKIFAFSLLVFMLSCTGVDPDESTTIKEFSLTEFDYFDDIQNVNTGLWRFNKSDKEASLGRFLFYDKILSLNNSTSCASCHKQSAAFAENRKISEGLFGELSKRNSTALMNSAFRGRYFWDGRRHDLSVAVLDPIKDHSEMAFEDFEKLIERLDATSYYPKLFNEAFGSTEITEERIGTAISEFVASMYTFDSKWDIGLNNNFENFTVQENAGRELFESLNCSSCHFGRDLDSYYSTANIGLDMEYTDQGVGNGQFRVPSLRNIALTGPYMHDGRYSTLEEVIDFYDHGIQANVNLSESLLDSNGNPIRLELTTSEKSDLIAFLETLTDYSLIFDERFSNPF